MTEKKLIEPFGWKAYLVLLAVLLGPGIALAWFMSFETAKPAVRVVVGVSMKLKNDELWVFRQSGGLISLEDGVYLDQRHLRPRMTKQIVVHGLTQNAAGAVSWAMTRAQDGRRYSSEAMADEIHESV